MRVNEIFYSLQGEGWFTGTAATFVRLSGCNLKCPFCDTDFSHSVELSEQEIVAAVVKNPSSHVVITGGEPVLQLTSSLVNKLKSAGKYVQIETNGTVPLPDSCDVDWVTCSPKFEFCQSAELKIQRIDELKVVFNGRNDMSLYEGITAKVYSLQPCDMNDDDLNNACMAASVAYCKQHPQWRLSLQTHKILKIR